MYQKHAIWRQCACVIPITMATAITLSIQGMTFSNDLYWSIVMCMSSIIQFVSAEHGHFYFTIDTWQKLQQHRDFVIRCIITTWSLAQIDISKHFTLIVCFGLSSLVVQKYHNFVLVPTILNDLMTLNTKSLVPLYFSMTCLREWSFEKSVGTSIADQPIRQAYGCSAIVVAIESTILWSLRCQYRFPYTFRWMSFIVSILSCVCACLWCSIFVKNTKVSRNAIIQRLGHHMAASLTAAEACPVCCKCLTSLDMESSFGDG